MDHEDFQIWRENSILISDYTFIPYEEKEEEIVVEVVDDEMGFLRIFMIHLAFYNIIREASLLTFSTIKLLWAITKFLYKNATIKNIKLLFTLETFFFILSCLTYRFFKAKLLELKAATIALIGRHIIFHREKPAPVPVRPPTYEKKRKIFLVTDVKDSTYLWNKHYEEMRRKMTNHHVLANDLVDKCHGILLRKEGDSNVAVFDEMKDVICFLVNFIVNVEKYCNNDDGPRIDMRVGVQEGECLVVWERFQYDYFGCAAYQVFKTCDKSPVGMVNFNDERLVSFEDLCTLIKK